MTHPHWQPPQFTPPAPPQPPRRTPWWQHPAIIIGGVAFAGLVLIMIVAGVMSGVQPTRTAAGSSSTVPSSIAPSPSTSPAATSDESAAPSQAPAPAPTVEAVSPTTTVAPAPPPPPPPPAVSSDQRNALRSAENYLDLTAFSRVGLIKQLEFEGYSNADATWAVDQVGADWNEQAVKSAKNYLELTSFSRQGLKDQLEFEGFTPAEAEYGVSQAY